MTRSPRRRALLLALLLLPAPLAGCLSREPPEKQRFRLSATRTGDAIPACDCSLRIAHFRVARTYERVGFVYQTGADTWESDFFNEFFSPPGVLVREVTGQWIRGSGLFGSVAGTSEFTAPDWLLEGRVQRLFVDVRNRRAPRVVMEIQFRLLDNRSRDREVALDRRYGVHLEATRDTPTAFLEAWNEALVRILTKLEADLRPVVTPEAAARG
jgi:cholesterol transport system auxiliary component